METIIDGPVLTIAGLEEFTAANAGAFRTQVCAALNGHSVVEVDLSRTTAMDCAGLGALIAVRNLAHRRNGAVRLVGAPPVVQRLFEVVRAGDLFDVVNVEAQVIPPFEVAAALSPSSSSLMSATR